MLHKLQIMFEAPCLSHQSKPTYRYYKPLHGRSCDAAFISTLSTASCSLIAVAPPNPGVELVSRFEKSFLTNGYSVVGALPNHTFSHQSKPPAPNIGQQYTCHLINSHAANKNHFRQIHSR